LLCPACSFVAKCKRCSVSLTYHKSNNILKCHHCDYSVKAISSCPKCGSIWLRYAGSGTQKLEQKVRDILPNEIVIRLDKDTSKNNKAGKTLEKFKKAKKAILLGTQIIGKGFDFKDIALVGIVNADTSLNFPDFRAGERTYQLIRQVAGRSGRGRMKGTVLIQSYNSDHYAIKAALKDNYEEFYSKEIGLRKELNYPPYSRLINIGFYSENFSDTRSASEELFKQLEQYSEIEVLGPCAAPIAKMKNHYRWHILIKTSGKLPKGLSDTLKKFRYKNINIAIDVDPQSLL